MQTNYNLEKSFSYQWQAFPKQKGEDVLHTAHKY
jgi:hypothetical protein